MRMEERESNNMNMGTVRPTYINQSKAIQLTQLT